MKNFINDLGVFPNIVDHVEIFYDNEDTVALIKEPKEHKCTRHIPRKFYYIRKLVEDENIIVSLISSEDNPTGSFTKPLS